MCVYLRGGVLSLDESDSNLVASSKTPRERLFRKKFLGTNVPKTKFGAVIEALWPDKPALNLAQRMGVSERNALQIMRGERRVTARALHVLNSEVLD